MAVRNKYDVDEMLFTPFNFAHIKRAFKYIKRQSKYMLTAFIMSSVSMVITLFMPRLLQGALDVYVPEKNFAGLLKNTVLTILCIITSVILTTLVSRFINTAGQNIIRDIRHDLFEHLQSLSFSYYDSRPGGKILVRIINYVNSVSDMLSNGVINFVLQLINLIFIGIFMLMMNFWLGLIIIMGLPLIILVIFSLKNMQRRGWQLFSNKSGNLNAYLNESIMGMKITQLFTREELNARIFEKLSNAMRSAWYKAVLPSNAVAPAVDIVAQIVICVMYFIGIAVRVPPISFGVVLAMGTYANRFWQPITQLANIYNSFLNNIAYLERIFETIDESVEIENAPDAYEMPVIKGDVEFKNVSFEYEKGVKVLNDVNFKIKAGETIALVGPTGAGKSTIVNLICRFYNPTEGKILIDGHDVTAVMIDSLRSQLGIMLQDSVVFSNTVKNNILYGKLDASDAEITMAAETVQASEFIDGLEKGYETVLPERGNRLSGGQKQLISFARTLIASPKILILDEATSSIDTKTEAQLQKGLAAMLKGRTSFIIAHRLSTIKSCDRIMYIDGGRLAESGTHEELMAKRGLYYELFTAQD